MLIVHVHVKVKKEYIEEFKSATLENARNSVQEKEIARFDILQSEEEPTEFILNEVYLDKTAPAAHKETDHYKKWRAEVEKMMEKPRSSRKFTNIFPEDDDKW